MQKKFYHGSPLCGGPDKEHNVRTQVYGLACLFLLLLMMFGCGGKTPPPVSPQPSPSSLTLHIQVSSQRGPEPGVTVSIQDSVNAGVVGVTNDDGQVFLRGLHEAGFTVCTTPTLTLWKVCAGKNLTQSGTLTLITVYDTPSPVSDLGGQLRVSGRRMVYPDGRIFRWRGVTAFALNDMVADGNEAGASAFMAWARRRGLNMVRVLGTLPNGWMDLNPEDGLRALPRFLTLAREHGLYVQLTLIANGQKLTKDGIRDFVRRAGVIAGGFDNTVIEIANEPYHSSQHEDLYSKAFMTELEALVPIHIPVAWGAARKDEGFEGLDMAGGDYVTVHMDRSRDKWNRVRRARELEMVSSESKKYVVDAEPFGFYESSQVGPNRRETDDNIAYAAGVLTRIFEIGGNIHLHDGLFGRVPGPVQTIAADAFVEGTKVVNDQWVLDFQNTGWATSPVLTANFMKAVRVYSGVRGSDGITIALGLTSDPGIVYKNAWSPVELITDRGAVKTWRIRKGN